MLKVSTFSTTSASAVAYKGAWDAATNTPPLASGIGASGAYYVVSVPGTTELDGVANWGVGDWAVFGATAWQRLEGGEQLNAKTLIVQETALFEGNITNTALNASQAVATDASKRLVSVANTGVGSNVLAESPSLSTPSLGVATAASVNKVTVTQPATGSTLTIADGKTLSTSATITLAGTDGKTFTLNKNIILDGVDGKKLTLNKNLALDGVDGKKLTLNKNLTLDGVDGKKLTLNKNLTLGGTDGTVMTFPTTSATLARTDAGNTFLGHQVIEGVTSTGATGTGKFVFSDSPVITGHLTVESVTSTGAAGTGKFVFSNSPALTGVPTAPTAVLGTVSTQIATTAFVQSALSSVTVISGGTFPPTKRRRVLFLRSSTTWVVPSGVDYCTARICGGGSGGSDQNGTPTAGANSVVSCNAGEYSGVGSDPVSSLYMGDYATCRSGREFSGQSALFASCQIGHSFTGLIPAAVNEFGINLIPGETVTITVGAGGAGGTLAGGAPGPGTANGGSGFVNIEYWI